MLQHHNRVYGLCHADLAMTTSSSHKHLQLLFEAAEVRLHYLLYAHCYVADAMLAICRRKIPSGLVISQINSQLR